MPAKKVVFNRPSVLRVKTDSMPNSILTKCGSIKPVTTQFRNT